MPGLPDPCPDRRERRSFADCTRATAGKSATLAHRCYLSLLTLRAVRGTVPVSGGSVMTGRFLAHRTCGFICRRSRRRLPLPRAGSSSTSACTGPRYDALVPLCDDRGVLIQIHSKFSHKESEFWTSNLEILGIERIRQVAFRPWAGAPQAVPRRFCNGVAHVSDGAATRSTIRSWRTPAGSASAGAWNGVWRGSTATGPTIRPAAWRGLNFVDRGAGYHSGGRRLWMSTLCP